MLCLLRNLGTWIRDLASSTAPVQHTFVGTDLDPTNFPIATPDNQIYQIQDINKSWPEEWNESFDFVHQRLVLNGAGRYQKSALGRLVALVKPGGWVQIMESTNEVPKDNGPVMRNFDTLLKGIFTSVGANIGLANVLPQWLHEAGFENVQSRDVQMRLGKMNTNPKLARQGTYSSIVVARSLVEFARSKPCRYPCPHLALVLIWVALPPGTITLSNVQLGSLGDDLNTELARQGGLYPLRVVWARKSSVAA